MARAVAHRLGHRAIFSPILDPNGVGNGTHIHFSLRDAADRPVMLRCRAALWAQPTRRAFVAGILHHLPALAAITAPSAASYYRLRPNRWAPTWANVAHRRTAAPSIRVCPIFGPRRGRRAAIQHRVPRRRRRREPLSGARRAGLGGGRRHPARNCGCRPEPSRPFWDMTEDERDAAGARPLPAQPRRGAAHLAATEVGSGLVRSAAPRCVSQSQTGRDPRSCGTERRRRSARATPRRIEHGRDTEPRGRDRARSCRAVVHRHAKYQRQSRGAALRAMTACGARIPLRLLLPQDAARRRAEHAAPAGRLPSGGDRGDVHRDREPDPRRTGSQPRLQDQRPRRAEGLLGRQGAGRDRAGRRRDRHPEDLVHPCSSPPTSTTYCAISACAT